MYNLSNPTERTRITIDAMRLFKNEDVTLSIPAALHYNFRKENGSLSPIMDAINFVIHHTCNVDYMGTFISAEIGNITSLDVFVSITTDYGTYIIKKLRSYDYIYEKDKTFAFDEEAKVRLMEREFNSRFSATELEDIMVSQSLAIIDANSGKTATMNKLEDFINRYYPQGWAFYNVEAKKIDEHNIYSLNIKLKDGTFVNLDKT